VSAAFPPRIGGRDAAAVVFDATPLEVRQPSGVSRYTGELLRALAARRDPWRLRVASSRRLEAGVYAGTAGAIGPGFPNRWLWMQLMLPALLARRRPALCHFTNYLAPLACPVPYVLTIYDMSLVLYPETQTRRNRILVGSILPKLARNAKAVLVPSEVSRQHVVALLGVEPARVHMTSGAVTAHYRPVQDASDLDRVQRRYAIRTPYVLAVGTLEPRKNLRRLILAFARLRRDGRDEHLVLTGQLGWKYDEMFAVREREHLKDVVHVIGYVAEADLPAIYSGASVLAFPSLYEGFGLPALEALACGTPVVTSRNSAMQEIAADAAVYVDAEDADSIAQGLANVLDRPELRERLRAEGLQRAARFTWPSVAERTADSYARVMREAANE
jgi:glycosyltransferase involved in cell wall biosynthesis